MMYPKYQVTIGRTTHLSQASPDPKTPPGKPPGPDKPPVEPPGPDKPPVEPPDPGKPPVKPPGPDKPPKMQRTECSLSDSHTGRPGATDISRFMQQLWQWGEKLLDRMPRAAVETLELSRKQALHLAVSAGVTAEKEQTSGQ